MDMSTHVMQEMSGAKLDVAWVREQFPSLKEQVAGAPAAFLDGPAGPQAPRQVMDAITKYLSHLNANTYGIFASSRWTNEMFVAGTAALVEIFTFVADEDVFRQDLYT